MKRTATLIGAGLLVGSVAAAFAWPERMPDRSSKPTPQARRSSASIGHQEHVHGERTVVVADRPDLGAAGGVLTVGFEHGTKPPASAVDAEVLTDENCSPDARGVSHCRNEIRMEDGTTVRIRHDHRMREVPCLVPGEHVRLRAA